jgi:hypothetical protein
MLWAAPVPHTARFLACDTCQGELQEKSNGNECWRE